MATDVKMIKFVYFVYVHPKAFHLTSYKENLFLTLASYIEKLPEITLKTQDAEVSGARSYCFCFVYLFVRFQNGNKG